MKKTLCITIILSMLVSSAWALSININNETIDVGEVDKYITSETLPNSGDKTEIEWVEKALKFYNYIGENDTINMDKYDDDKYTFYQVKEEGYANTYALDFSTYQPEYFFIKIGDGSLDGFSSHYLYENLASLDWGVINLAALGATVIGVDRISHVGEINGTAPVPEPATMLLLGAGLLGLAGFRRKINK